MTFLTRSELPRISATRSNRTGSFKLRLTSMIDMFTILLVFLLKSYSAEGQIITITADLRLPESTSQIQPRVTSVVAVTSEWILLDGRPITRIEQVMQKSDLLIQPLADELQRLRAISEGIGEMSTRMAGFQGTLSIQADREMTFDLIKRIMLTCGKVGYNNMMLTVMQAE
ncbi:biopolymer transporter ExbD [candidate division KSB1 bacterium]|nr:biopolymer transporter ExbD [candidate division KSB1 bacterium]